MRQWINLVESFNHQWKKRIAYDVEVWIDVEKLNASWRHDRYTFFDSPDHKNAINGRYERFGNWISGGEAIEMAEVSLSHEGEIVFTNGRHRFVWLKDHGVKHMPVAVPAEQADEIRDRFGA